MPAIPCLSGAAAFKNHFRVKYSGGYVVILEKTDRNKRYGCNTAYFQRVNVQCIGEGAVSAVFIVLQPENFERKLLKILLLHIKNFIF